MGALKSSSISFVVKDTNLAEYSFIGSDFNQEKSLILVEFYYKNDSWSLAVVGQGFNGGLEALLNHFGGVAEHYSNH